MAGKSSSDVVVDYDVETEVKRRYAAGALAAEAALCCPVEYDPKYLKVIPREILERDYGCGDPSRYVQTGETVLDLGCGGGKICYILAQKVGPHGRVIGVDMNDAMLALARKYQDPIAQAIGWKNTEFRKGRIQDLALPLDEAEEWLRRHPIRSIDDLQAFEAECDRLRRHRTLIANDSIDVIVSNCVLNLVRPSEKKRLFAEMFRVLRRGGRCVISDIVCDEPPTPAIMNDPKLWSGCISGAFVEAEFLEMFEQAGFYGVEILARADAPWQTIDGIEFRSMTVRAYKGKEGECLEHNQAIIYKGPWKQVKDDDNHVFLRGQRMAVCKKTFDLMTNPNGPYATQVIGVEPLEAVRPEQARPFDCKRLALRHPRETKGQDYRATTQPDGSCCGPEGCC
ncbi:MAG: methyltransferase domain-containing protein [Phycisphaerae bacterium]|nr:methyltransferase domain-containing protein [Phycisphaerae bacterium]MDW8263097.1 methyltransferase domain-containing protein [Phycisphaerales bacterium]